MIDYRKASQEVLEAVRGLLVAGDVDTAQGETVERVVVKLLGLAWANAVRAEWQAFVDADPELKAQHAVAKELMREDGYTMEQDPICGLPGAKPMVAIVDGKEAVCLDHSMAQVTPLSAIYVNKVRIVQSAAARASKALMEEAAKTPAQWPIKIASGETFNSIEEMEQSPIDAVKEMAHKMRLAALGLSVEKTCWQYFEFDGPVSLDRLAAAYRGKIVITFDSKLVSEIHQQYQNCLKELGTAIMDGGSNG